MSHRNAGRLASRGVAARLASAAVLLVIAGCGGGAPLPGGPATVRAIPTGGPNAGGGASAPAASPPAAALPGEAWQTETVELPAQVSAPYASGKAPVFCSPCHGAGIAMAAVATDGARLVAVGSIFPDSRAVVWTSMDGRRWTLVRGLPAGCGSLATGVAIADGSTVVVGGDGEHAAAWVGQGTGSWSEVVLPAAPGTAARMTAVVARPGGGFVGVGTEGPSAAPAGVAWTSPDGSSWTASSRGGALAEGRPLALTVGADGSLVAVGSVTRGGIERPAAWRSSDGGDTWSEAALPPATGASAMRGVTVGGPGYVAVGSSNDGIRAAAWTSPDGSEWSRVPDRPGFANYDQRIAMASVAGGPIGLVAVGGRDSVGNGSPVAWTSPDGITWSRVPDPPSFSGGEMTAIVPYGPGYVAVGSLGWPDNTYAVAWSSPG